MIDFKRDTFFTKWNIILTIITSLLLLINHRFGYITALTVWTLMMVFVLPIIRFANVNFCGVLAFTIFYSLFAVNSGFISTFSSAVAYILPLPLFYLFGRYVMSKINRSEDFYKFILILFIAYTLDVFLSLYLDILLTGSLVNTSRSFSFYFDEGSELAATLVGMQVYPCLIGFVLFFILYRSNKILSFIYLLLASSALLTTVHLVNRTGLVIFVIASGLMFINHNRKNLFRLILPCLIIGVITLVVYLGYDLDNSEVMSAYSDRGDDVSSAGSRTFLWSHAIKKMFIHPFGWSDAYVDIHNMWLDIAKVAGIIPFIILVLITIQSIITLCKILRFRKAELSTAFLGLYVCFFLSLFVEPIRGSTHLFLFVMLWGMQESYLYKLKRS